MAWRGWRWAVAQPSAVGEVVEGNQGIIQLLYRGTGGRALEGGREGGREGGIQ